MKLYILALACHIAATNAFYPYRLGEPTNQPSRRQEHARRDSGSLRLPIRKVKTKRAGGFKINSANKPSASNSAGLDQDGADYSYMCEVQFGSGKKTIYLLLDTAAVNTWVMSSDCKSDACPSHNQLGPGDSSSLQVTQSTFSVQYGTGSVSGSVVSDNVSFIGKTFPLSFGLASVVSDDFKSYPMDGILGVGRLQNVASNQNGVKAPTVVDVLVSQKIINAKVFGIRLSRASDGLNNGEITFGGPDTDAYSGDLNYVSAITNDRGFWELTIDSVSFNGKTAAIQNGATALLDSGTSLLLLPPSDAQAVHDTIPGSAKNGETFTVPCNTATPLTISFGGKAYTISPKDYIGSATSNGNCNSNIAGRQTFNSNQWLVGDVFLKNVYTVFDGDQGRVGFSLLKGSSISTPSSPTPPISQTTTSMYQPTVGGSSPPPSSPSSSETSQTTAPSQSAAPGTTSSTHIPSSQGTRPPTTNTSSNLSQTASLTSLVSIGSSTTTAPSSTTTSSPNHPKTTSTHAPASGTAGVIGASETPKPPSSDGDALSPLSIGCLMLGVLSMHILFLAL
ncbi:acid protease [Microthyrium microscopicum]|uniref:Acid protease n=1 Tax=Microthyrium microscopicum TaxID=703497 RepID=A0A6A6U1C6_9PEZI|nr:acid protease [Microthyrium microscopicum]